MPGPRTVRIDAIHRRLRLAVRDDGVMGRMVSFHDKDGDPVDRIEDAFYVIVEWPNFTYSPVMLADYPVSVGRH